MRNRREVVCCSTRCTASHRQLVGAHAAAPSDRPTDRPTSWPGPRQRRPARLPPGRSPAPPAHSAPAAAAAAAAVAEPEPGASPTSCSCRTTADGRRRWSDQRAPRRGLQEREDGDIMLVRSTGPSPRTTRQKTVTSCWSDQRAPHRGLQETRR